MRQRRKCEEDAEPDYNTAQRIFIQAEGLGVLARTAEGEAMKYSITKLVTIADKSKLQITQTFDFIASIEEAEVRDYSKELEVKDEVICGLIRKIKKLKEER